MVHESSGHDRRSEVLSTNLAGADPDEVFRLLSSREEGLNETEAIDRLRAYGSNLIHAVGRRSLVWEFLGNFTHPMAWLLWFGGLIAFITQAPELGIAIWLVNLINGSFSFWQEFKAEKAVEALRQMIPTYARVRRAGQEHRILAEALVPGDVVLLAEGDRISADARLVRATDLRVDQSTMTGESRPISKTSNAVFSVDHPVADLPNLVFAGTSVVGGSGTAVAFATGMTSEFGKIARLTQCLGQEPNPLQRELGKVTGTITWVAFAIACAFFWAVHAWLGMSYAGSFMIALGMLIAFVPEGLLPTLSLSLAIGVQRMAKRHALIKTLASVETLGRTTIICTDKTGTLTENQMTVTALWLWERSLVVEGLGYSPEGQLLEGKHPIALDPDLRQLLRAGILCNDAHLRPPHTEIPQWTAEGDPTEAALLVLAHKGGLDLKEEARRAPRLVEHAFNSYRRRMSTVHQVGAGQVAYMKGAPPEVLARCSTLRNAGMDLPLDEPRRAAIESARDRFARDGLRVLALALKELSVDGLYLGTDDLERGMTFLGLVAMHDPPRPDVPEAIARCHGAGIRLIMLTGDYSLTAQGIARAIGIVRSEQPTILTGSDLDAMDPIALRQALSGEVIGSRITPEHKLRIVRTLQEMGNIVAVTGDGVNDAPALRQADIGVAMGIAGTDVAKEAADMILTDDHFASIVNAVEEGRAVYENIRKFILYVFGSNMAEGLPFVATLFSGGLIPLPITVMQTLAIDLGTDMVPAIGLGSEVPEEGVMNRPPRSHDERLLSPAVLGLGLTWYGAIDSIAAFASYFFLNWEHGWPAVPLAPVGSPVYPLATTMTFAGVVAAQMGSALACRSETVSLFRLGLFTNRLITWGIGIEVALLLLLMYHPMLQTLFGTAPISTLDWLFVMAWGPLLLLMDEVRKAFLRKTGRSGGLGPGPRQPARQVTA